MGPTAAHCRVKAEEGDVQIAARPLHFICRVSEAEVGEKTVAILDGQRDSLLVGGPFLRRVDLDADGNHALVTVQALVRGVHMLDETVAVVVGAPFLVEMVPLEAPVGTAPVTHTVGVHRILAVQEIHRQREAVVEADIAKPKARPIVRPA